MPKVIRRLFKRILNRFHSEPAELAIVRRYLDANGNYVGELYLKHPVTRVSVMIGASLDSHEFFIRYLEGVTFDYKHDFLEPLPPETIRIGAIDPRDLEQVRNIVADLEGRYIVVEVRNGFIEAVMEAKL